ncbi:MAG TPA: acyl-CoA dehydrogenase family protein [Candidatus Acidoferrum sp.]|nr:acyl-CoA dehydrogenase family protein [Candidatus Acidoferrum sp.]
MRSFLFGPEHDAFRQTVRQFIEREVAPHAEQWERDGGFPRDLFRRFGDLDLLGLQYPEAYGGTNAGPVYEAVLMEELSRCGSGGVAGAIGAHIAIATPPIFRHGSEEQKQRWLIPAVKGTAIAALAITEPGGGSDVAALRTRAVRNADHYVVNGSKLFITNGTRADFLVTAVRTKEQGGHRGISLLVVERGTPGFKASRLETLGWRTSETSELSFADARVPIGNLLGEENHGFGYIMETFQWERIWAAVSSAAGAQRSLELATAYARERVTFGHPLAELPVIRHRLADMALEVEAARRLAYHALWLYATGQPCVKEVSMAKLAATEAAVRVADQALQIFGGYGYSMEFPIQRAWRDARLGPIGGGTSEIMREIIARELDL